jgi:hypothetical protein
MNINNSSPAGIRVNIIVLAFTLVSSMTVFLRLFTRLVISRMAGWEDACIVMAMVSGQYPPGTLYTKFIQVFSVALAVLTIEQVVNGLGEHTSELDKGQLDILLKVGVKQFLFAYRGNSAYTMAQSASSFILWRIQLTSKLVFLGKCLGLQSHSYHD